jgi:hypothetical protein
MTQASGSRLTSHPISVPQQKESSAAHGTCMHDDGVVLSQN